MMTPPDKDIGRIQQHTNDVWVVVALVHTHSTPLETVSIWFSVTVARLFPMFPRMRSIGK
ncbi:hypothetical protein Cflav_PD0809 [Pedosphaera parvula Ellin514]|uniref:Uncharacterized protein n=1 Tax=Pedosphaera parvula (strain Ellin514) TaxID=320771 RepID=B9XQP5_PEDPL|nr:hypothetical protein Cflav_PD0809 [Pedosphaera parvula Ellin514]